MSAIRAATRNGASQRKRRRPGIPPNLFVIALGLAGLGQAWHAARPVLTVPQAVPDAIFILAAAVWLVLIAGYGAQGLRRVLADLRDPVLSPFVPVAAITPMILGATLSTAAFAAGRVVVVIFLAVTIAAGGWLTGQWVAGNLDQDSTHPGYLLPTATGGLVGANAAAQVHLHAVAEASFGIGIVCWLLLYSTIVNRLFFRRALPAALLPTLAIELAPPAVAGSAYFALSGGATNFIAYALGGYTVLMALVQLRFVPLYAGLRFSPGFWTFTFPYAAAAADALCGSRSQGPQARPDMPSLSSRWSPPSSRRSPPAASWRQLTASSCRRHLRTRRRSGQAASPLGFLPRQDASGEEDVQVPDKQRRTGREFMPGFKADAMELVRTLGPADRPDRPGAGPVRLHAGQLAADGA